MESGNGADILDYLIAGGVYIIIVIPAILIFYALSKNFRANYKIDSLVLTLSPILIYVILEVNFEHQSWNFINANLLLALIAVGTLIPFVSDERKKLAHYSLIFLNFLAVLLWFVMPSASMRLF